MISFIENEEKNKIDFNKVKKCENIHDALYKFSQKRYKSEILKSEDMRRIVLHYFNRPEYTPYDRDEEIVGEIIIKDCSN